MSGRGRRSNIPRGPRRGSRDQREASPRGTTDGNIRQRDYPPGPGDEMDSDEYGTMMVSNAIADLNRTGSRRQAEPPKPPNHRNASGQKDSSDDNLDGEEEEEDRTDNPPRPPGPNATTLGFEFEVMMAVSRCREDIPDPHPKDGRWLSDALINLDSNSLAYRYTARNKIIDELIQAGVVAHKTREFFGFYQDTFDWWDSLDYQAPNTNDPYIMNWRGQYLWNTNMTEDENVSKAISDLMDQFRAFHHDHGLEIYQTREGMIREARDNIPLMIKGVCPREAREKIMTLWFEQMNRFIHDQRQRHYSSSAAAKDPNIPTGLEHQDVYNAWSATDDCTICTVMPGPQEYRTLPDSLPENPLRPGTVIRPPRLYRWFGAEIISSILDYDHPETRPTLIKVCESVRNSIRIHKPMSTILSGVHVHIGQQAGWTLLHLKKFATLWHLVEPSMFKLQRLDREQGEWCAPMATESNLAMFVLEGDRDHAEYSATTTGALKRTYETQMRRYIPRFLPRPKLHQYFSNIWQHRTIDDLNAAMRNGGNNEVCIRWRITGQQRSGRALPHRTQTLEFRLMQGTLDADHIWRWASILERLVIFARDSTAARFRTTITTLMNKDLPDSLGLNKQDLEWFNSRRWDNEYFAYPDEGDLMDWADPFMVPGHGDTHGWQG
ncbi:hypothetical protein F5Y10DRAFT_265327 [Nemania abortiva]|nr:hypothetical protein F5Y10DRAFT_265327 [Nemania abortiva]